MKKMLKCEIDMLVRKVCNGIMEKREKEWKEKVMESEVWKRLKRNWNKWKKVSEEMKEVNGCFEVSYDLQPFRKPPAAAGARRA